jgi:hypothetical protein
LLGFLQHRRIIHGQNRLKQLRDGPLHWELPLPTSQACMKTSSLSATLTTRSGPRDNRSKCSCKSVLARFVRRARGEKEACDQQQTDRSTQL